MFQCLCDSGGRAVQREHDGPINIHVTDYWQQGIFHLLIWCTWKVYDTLESYYYLPLYRVMENNFKNIKIKSLVQENILFIFHI